MHDISDLPTTLVLRIEHYFLSYKPIPGEPGTVSIPMIHGVEHAPNVVRAAMRDYGDTFGER